MNLIDQLTQMQANGKTVVSISFILNSLGSIERHECENCRQLPIYDMATFTDGYKLVKGGS